MSGYSFSTAIQCLFSDFEQILLQKLQCSFCLFVAVFLTRKFSAVCLFPFRFVASCSKIILQFICIGNMFSYTITRNIYKHPQELRYILP